MIIVCLNALAKDPPLPELRYRWDVYDCDTCGCGGNGGSMGFGTGLNNNFVGLRYIGQRYRAKDGIFANSPWIDENFNTIQVWAQLPVGRRWIVNALMPYHTHSRTFADGAVQDISGLGDATLLGFYNVFARDSIMAMGPVHTLQLGGGLKLPTGEFDQSNLEGSVNPSFQLGTGSWDYLLAANYGLALGDWGLSALVNYTFKTENDQEYRFGNQFNYALNGYRYFSMGRLSLAPQLGLGGEHFGTNTSYGLEVNDTGGEVFLGRVGVEARYDRLALGISGMAPLWQDLNHGKVEVKNRVSIYLNLNI